MGSSIIAIFIFSSCVGALAQSPVTIVASVTQLSPDVPAMQKYSYLQGYNVAYEYDRVRLLKLVKDNIGNIVKTFQCHYTS